MQTKRLLLGLEIKGWKPLSATVVVLTVLVLDVEVDFGKLLAVSVSIPLHSGNP